MWVVVVVVVVVELVAGKREEADTCTRSVYYGSKEQISTNINTVL
jgi:hypothetical protein